MIRLQLILKTYKKMNKVIYSFEWRKITLKISKIKLINNKLV